jgi:hypothetical protein
MGWPGQRGGRLRPASCNFKFGPGHMVPLAGGWDSQ